MTVEGRQLLLEAGQDDRWLVSDLDATSAEEITASLHRSRDGMRGLQFIAVQTTPEEQSFAGFWMLRDIPMG